MIVDCPTKSRGPSLDFQSTITRTGKSLHSQCNTVILVLIYAPQQGYCGSRDTVCVTSTDTDLLPYWKLSDTLEYESVHQQAWFMLVNSTHLLNRPLLMYFRHQNNLPSSQDFQLMWGNVNRLTWLVVSVTTVNQTKSTNMQQMPKNTCILVTLAFSQENMSSTWWVGSGGQSLSIFSWLPTLLHPFAPEPTWDPLPFPHGTVSSTKITPTPPDQMIWTGLSNAWILG